jgi:hypothetical protein
MNISKRYKNEANLEIKELYNWGNSYGHEIPDKHDLTLVEYLISNYTSDYTMASYLEANGHEQYIPLPRSEHQINMEALEEQVELERSMNPDTRLSQSINYLDMLAFLVLNCCNEQMGKGKEPVHKVEIDLMEALKQISNGENVGHYLK